MDITHKLSDQRFRLIARRKARRAGPTRHLGQLLRFQLNLALSRVWIAQEWKTKAAERSQLGGLGCGCIFTNVLTTYKRSPANHKASLQTTASPRRCLINWEESESPRQPLGGRFLKRPFVSVTERMLFFKVMIIFT